MMTSLQPSFEESQTASRFTNKLDRVGKMSSDSHSEAVKSAFDAEINAGPVAEEAMDLSGDGGVMKTILKEGTGWESPKKGVEVAGTLILDLVGCKHAIIALV